VKRHPLFLQGESDESYRELIEIMGGLAHKMHDYAPAAYHGEMVICLWCLEQGSAARALMDTDELPPFTMQDVVDWKKRTLSSFVSAVDAFSLPPGQLVTIVARAVPKGLALPGPSLKLPCEFPLLVHVWRKEDKEGQLFICRDAESVEQPDTTLN
jgi:hypothetical protein